MFHWFMNLFRLSSHNDQLALDAIGCGDVVYELPFESGSRFFVLQGYGGAYSHTEDSYYSIDFQMPEGTSVCAARSGIVYRVINHFTSGGADLRYKSMANAIYILHPDDSIAAYVHFKHLGNFVVAGDMVSAGQVIGYSGNTGWSSTPHLHFHVADAIQRVPIPTRFKTQECGPTILEEGRRYSRPASQSSIAHKQPSTTDTRIGIVIHRDPFNLSPELSELAQIIAEDLAEAGYDRMAEYASIDIMHDVHGLEVCGIRSAEHALEITRILLRRRTGWNAGWIHAPLSYSDGWVARIQRNVDLDDECWDVD